jgi:MoaA/NifB/PqqE/SkfB family radical SAM enzyme
MYIDELVLEITRRCNIECRHCLRGKAQSRNMSFETIRQTLKGVSSIGNITFTGGEPCLAVDRIRYFTDYVRGWNIDVNNFYVITNGKIASTSLKDALIKLSWLCQGEGNSLQISQDQFHKELGYSQWPAKELYDDLPFFYGDARQTRIEWPIDEGLAFSNGLGVRSPNINHPVINPEIKGVEGTVYVNVNGDVIPCCDMSYANQELEKIGSVYDKPIFDIVKQYADQLQEV